VNKKTTFVVITIMISMTGFLILNFGLNNNSQVNSSNFMNFNFVAVGDWGCNLNTETIVKNMQEKDPEIVLGLGDYSYKDSSECWFETVEPLIENMRISIGNHDTDSSEKLKSYFENFGLENQYYSFDFRNVHFIVLSTEPLLILNSTQYSFVEKDLINTASDPRYDWIIIYYHMPSYISPNSAHEPLINFTSLYHPLFEKYGVDLVLQGHVHNYERSFPIKFDPNNSTNPIITDRNENLYNEPDGQIFATVGTGGAALHSFRGKDYHAFTQYVGFGFMNIEIVDEGKTLDAKFYTRDGSIWDHFIIRKEG